MFKKDFNFLGFVMADSQRDYYKKQYPKDKNHINLNNWHNLEKKILIFLWPCINFGYKK